MKNLKILIVDDHPIFRNGFRRLLERGFPNCIILEAGNGVQALEATSRGNIDIVFLDIQMPEMDGLETLKHIKRTNPETKVIMCSTFVEDDYVQYVIEEKGNGFLSKTCSLKEIFEAINIVLNGGLYLEKEIEERKNSGLVTSSIPWLNEVNLTPRELDVLMLINFRNEEIAEKLGISTKTVLNIKGSLMNKVKVNSTRELYLFAKKNLLLG